MRLKTEHTKEERQQSFPLLRMNESLKSWEKSYSEQAQKNMRLVWSHDYLERGRKVILEEPELDRCVGVPEDGQHHYSEIDRRE